MTPAVFLACVSVACLILGRRAEHHSIVGQLPLWCSRADTLARMLGIAAELAGWLAIVAQLVARC